MIVLIVEEDFLSSIVFYYLDIFLMAVQRGEKSFFALHVVNDP